MKVKTITKEWLQQQQGTCGWYINDWFLPQNKTDTVEVLEELIKQHKLGYSFASLRFFDFLDYGNWLLSRVADDKQCLSYAIYAAEQVIDLYESKFPEDKRPRLAIEAAKLVLEQDTEENRMAALAYAHGASNASGEAADPDVDSAYHVRCAAYAARAAAYAAKAAGRASSDYHGGHSAATQAWAYSAAQYAADSAAYVDDPALTAPVTTYDALYANTAALAASPVRAEMLTKIINYGIQIIKEQK